MSGETCMIALPERGTYRPFTKADIDRLGVPQSVVEGFIMAVFAHYIGLKDYLPTSRTTGVSP